MGLRRRLEPVTLRLEPGLVSLGHGGWPKREAGKCFAVDIDIPTVETFIPCTSRSDVCQCQVVQTPLDNMSKDKPSTSMTHVSCESKLRSFMTAIGRAVVYHAQAFSAGITYRHCTCMNSTVETGTKSTLLG